jgi:truncated hemoglobin YjbI
MRSLYEEAGGSEGLLRLAEAWHHRVMADEIVSHAFSWAMRWKPALNAFAITFDGRIVPSGLN